MHYFVFVVNDDPTHSNDRIHKSFQTKFTLAYLEFLIYQHERFNSFNLFFQSERPLLQSLKPEVERLIRSVASDFMTMYHVKDTKPKEIIPTCSRFHVPLEKDYVGMAVTATLREIEVGARREDVMQFRSDCKNFLVESIVQIKKRFDLDAEIHEIVQCTLPENAASMMPPSLEAICRKLPYLSEMLDTEKLDREWRQHAFESKIKPDLHWDEYWTIIRDAKNPSGQQKYPVLTRFVSILASIPFSNAAVERIFSSLELIKSDRRASLKSSSLVSLLQFKMAMKNGKFSSPGLQPSNSMLKLAYNMKASATDAEVKDIRKKFLDEFFE